MSRILCIRLNPAPLLPFYQAKLSQQVTLVLPIHTTIEDSALCTASSPSRRTVSSTAEVNDSSQSYICFKYGWAIRFAARIPDTTIKQNKILSSVSSTYKEK